MCGVLSPHGPAGCLVCDDCWSRRTVVGIQQSGQPASVSRARVWEHKGAVSEFTYLDEQFALGGANRNAQNKVHTYIHLLYLYAKQLLPTHQYSWAETGTDAGTHMRFHFLHLQLIMNLFFYFVS